MLIILIDGLDYRAKVSLFAFLSAMTLWVATKIPAGFVAVGLLVFIVLMKAVHADLLYDSLAEEVVWLMIGSFIIGEAVKRSGLAERFSQSIMSRSRKKSQVLVGIYSFLFASAFFIPSTSGRAALSMPIMKQLSLAFSLVITVLTFVIIKGKLWPKNELEKMENVPREEIILSKQPLNEKEKKTLLLISMLIIGWVTEGIHGYDIAFITMLGAILVMLPHYGVISWRNGMKSVSWNLIVFVAAATALGKVLVDTGVVGWMETEMFSVLRLFVNKSE